MSSFQQGQRVRCPGGLTGEVIIQMESQVDVYMGVYDGKRVVKTFPSDRVRPTIEQELEDLL